MIQIKGNPFAEVEVKHCIDKLTEEEQEKVWEVVRTFRRISEEDLSEYAEKLCTRLDKFVDIV